MTQKEIEKFLTNTKVYVNGKSKEIQEKLFSLGYTWFPDKVKVEFADKPFLYIFNSKILHYGGNMEDFSDSKNKEITAGQILALELTEPTYRPFKNIEECLQEMLKHQPFGWLKMYKKSCEIVQIGRIFNSKYGGIMITWSSYPSQNFKVSEIFKNFAFMDGTPFGIKEE